MLVHNLTFIVEKNIAELFLEQLKASVIPKIEGTACFSSYTVFKVLHSPNEGVTYCLQLFAPDYQGYEKFQKEYAQILFSEFDMQYSNRYVLYASLMEEL